MRYTVYGLARTSESLVRFRKLIREPRGGLCNHLPDLPSRELTDFGG